MTRLLISSLFVLAFISWTPSSVSYAQDVGERTAVQRYIETASFMKTLRDIVLRDNIKQELGIVDYQLETLKTISEKFRKDSRAIGLKAGAKLNPILTDDTLSESESQRLQLEINIERFAAISKAGDSLNAEIDNVLLPHQLKRLKQLSAQKEMLEQAGRDRSRLFLAMAQRIGMSEVEKKDFEKQYEDIRKSHLEEAAALKKKYDQKLIDALPENAKKKLTEIFGELLVD